MTVTVCWLHRLHASNAAAEQSIAHLQAYARPATLTPRVVPGYHIDTNPAAIGYTALPRARFSVAELYAYCGVFITSRLRVQRLNAGCMARTKPGKYPTFTSYAV